MGALISFPNPTGGEPEVTKKQLAAHLQVTERTIERWVDKGMPAIKAGPSQQHSIRFKVSEVDAWRRGQAA